VKFGAHAFAQYGYLAGNDTERASDVMTMFSDPTVKFIVANRGGYGTTRILDMLDYDVIKANPKPIMGYSDMTGLINAIHTKTGMVTFHGPMGIDDWTDGQSIWNLKYVRDVILNAKQPVYENLPQYASSPYTITSGKARGRLIGGNLSLFSAMIGSNYLPSNITNGTILFLEDVNEDPYQMDRMLTSLHLGGLLNNISGFVFGICTGCAPPDPGFTLQQVLEARFQPLGVPAFAGAMFGHDLTAQFTLPVGVEVEIDADQGTITLLEPAVE